MYDLHRLSFLRVKRAGGQKQRLWRKIGVQDVQFCASIVTQWVRLGCKAD
jgi:hypothetical protein